LLSAGVALLQAQALAALLILRRRTLGRPGLAAKNFSSRQTNAAAAHVVVDRDQAEDFKGAIHEAQLEASRRGLTSIYVRGRIS
jgi:hypothetical protein